ncbi:inner membrane complex protein 1h [Plasmodium gonderi]|uniref:Inner membrane complex protein 1h n=1 Tax=Plasmodium gonderi TaxID=77519 RepID=A0A1Y1JM92_PLAGO|nr:inner membrane complex protein 1h [Plasmodium gonderi]GAW83591.1 inner membrane complex protein 1h [Plasmodium gonderi]
MSHKNVVGTNKDGEEINGEINFDNLTNSMLEKMDKHIHEETKNIYYMSENAQYRNIHGGKMNVAEVDKTNHLLTPHHINEQYSVKQIKGIDEHTIHADAYPRRVMTALGPLPLPEEFKKNIPEKFVAKPIIEEREIYVSKRERKQREIEIPHVKYEHTFENVKKQLIVNKLVPSVSEVIKEVPKEVLKPVIEEKIIEVPQGVKYVEVPVEVPCLYPPKIIPKVVTQYVERIVETIKPVVQEKIIEVPQTVIKQVPKIKTVEVPYYVPRYVEKIVEVPFKPNGEMPQLGTHIPFPISESFPPLKPTQYLNCPENQLNQFSQSNQFSQFDKSNQFSQPNQVNQVQAQRSILSQINCFSCPEKNTMNSSEQIFTKSSARPTVLKAINSNASSGTNAVNPTRNIPMNSNSPFSSDPEFRKHENLYSQIEHLPYIHNLPDGMKWQYPDGTLSSQQIPPNSNTAIPPLVFTCPPEIGRVTCTKKDIQPDILTKTGVYEFDGFKKKGTSQSLFPPLAHHDRVPFLPSPAVPGTPDVKNIQENN